MLKKTLAEAFDGDIVEITLNPYEGLKRILFTQSKET